VRHDHEVMHVAKSFRFARRTGLSVDRRPSVADDTAPLRRGRVNRPLIAALHGVGSSARDMAAALAPLERVAEVVTLDGGEPFDGGGQGRQWFSIAGVTDADRPRRVANALPALLERLDRLARSRDMRREELVLLGFSQGAMMALAMVAQQFHPGRAVAIAGRLAVPVLPAAGRPASLLLVHDLSDPVAPPSMSRDAADRLGAASHHVRLVHTEGIGHGIGRATLGVIAEWLAATASARAASTSTEG
jgi:phospholipase/carboxylesterase